MTPKEEHIEAIATIRGKSERRAFRTVGYFMCGFAAVWSVWNIHIGNYQTASLTSSYMLAGALALLASYTGRGEGPSRHLVLLVATLAPFAFQLVYGGWHPSGMVMLWTLPGLVAAVNLQSGNIRYAYLLVIGLMLTGFSFWDPGLLIPEVPYVVNSNILLAFNLSGSMAVSFLLADHMLNTQRTLRKRVFGIQKEANEHFVRTLEERNSSMEQSLDYAARIQMALWPDTQRLQGIFEQMNVLYEPKEAVGGDFLWHARVEDRSYFMVLDCTGHGVPGSLMSMLIHGLLNEVVHSGKNLGAAEVVRRTQQLLNDRLNRDRTGNTDGAEMAVVCFDHSRREVRCCSYGCGIIVQNEEGTIPLKNRSSNSSLMQGSLSDQLNEHLVSVDDDTRLFLYTDGVADQFCTDDKRKFSRARLESVITDSARLAAKEQMDNFQEEFNTWRGDTPPVDDVLLVSVVVASCWKTIVHDEREINAA